MPNTTKLRVLEEEIYCWNPTVLIYIRSLPEGRFFVIEKSSDEPPFIIDSFLTARALIELPEDFSKEVVIKAWEKLGIESKQGEVLWKTLIKGGFLLQASKSSKQLTTFKKWGAHGWSEAYRYHFGTKNYPFLQMNTERNGLKDSNRMEKYLSELSPPSIFQLFVSDYRVFLKKVDWKENLDEYVKELNPAQIKSIEGLSVIFDLCFGVRKIVPFPYQKENIGKSVPSGGARHPTEVFLFVFDETLLKPGLYHYNVKDHSLDRIKKGNDKKQCENATFDLFKKYNETPRGLVVFTAINERAMWRYREPRSWRAVLMDIGHVVMLFRQLSNFFNFKVYTYQKFKDSQISKLIGIDKARQTPLYVSTII